MHFINYFTEKILSEKSEKLDEKTKSQQKILKNMRKEIPKNENKLDR